MSAGVWVGNSFHLQFQLKVLAHHLFGAWFPWKHEEALRTSYDAANQEGVLFGVALQGQQKIVTIQWYLKLDCKAGNHFLQCRIWGCVWDGQLSPQGARTLQKLQILVICRLQNVLWSKPYPEGHFTSPLDMQTFLAEDAWSMKGFASEHIYQGRRTNQPRTKIGSAKKSPTLSLDKRCRNTYIMQRLCLPVIWWKYSLLKLLNRHFILTSKRDMMWCNLKEIIIIKSLDISLLAIACIYPCLVTCPNQQLPNHSKLLGYSPDGTNNCNRYLCSVP